MLNDDLVCCNDLILTELAPSLIHHKKLDVLEGLEILDKVNLEINWKNIRQYQLLNLQNGINKVGIPDLIIVQQVIQQNIILFSYDKHFKMMKNFLDFDLIS